jgi:hypothetical protein
MEDGAVEHNLKGNYPGTIPARFGFELKFELQLHGKE